MMRHVLPLLGMLIVAGVGCATSSAGNSNSTDDNLTQASVDAASVAERAECLVANGRTELATFDTTSFDPARTMASLQEDNRDRGCGAHRTSTSREDAIAMVKAFLAENDEVITMNCEDDADPHAATKLKADLVALVEDPTNQAVFAAVPVPGSSDDEVHCYYYRFDVYRADGNVVRFVFDWSA